MKCLGCDREIAWDGKGLFAYTCPCGATVFYDEEKGLALPASLFTLDPENPPHIDYYLGKSNYWSKRKQEMYEYLKSQGAVWSWQCPKCRDWAIKRAKMEKDNGFYPFEFHWELSRLMEVEMNV